MIGIIYKFTIIAKYKFYGHKPFYVGQHVGEDDFDSYDGSGAIWNNFLDKLKKDYPKNWRKLVKREVLYIHECSQKTLDKLEEYYIKKCKSHYSYKKSRKGKYCGVEHFMYGKHWDEATKKKNRESNVGKQSGEKHWHFGKHWSDEVKKKIGDANRGKTPWLGKHHTEETKKKLSEHFTGKKWTNKSRLKMSNSVRGKNNPMFGKIRINNGIVNKIINKGDKIPDGFVLGMLRYKH